MSKCFLNELKSLYQCYSFLFIIKYIGITQDPKTKEYVLIMDYAYGGDLHNYLQKDFVNITWEAKFYILESVSMGLESIHDKNFIHRDFHSGNILLMDDWKEWCIGEWCTGELCIGELCIGDLGLSQPANSTSNNEIYGIIPYIAPEIFRGAAFSKESDIYSMGMIMWEFTTGCKPFANVEHDINLIYKIIDGKRPEITSDTPECYANLMKRCLDTNPLRRPSINEISEAAHEWYSYYNPKYSEKPFKQAEKRRIELLQSKKLGPEFSEKPHPKAIFTSRALCSLISKSSSINLSPISTRKYNKTLMEESNNKTEYISKEYELDIDIDIQRTSLSNINGPTVNSSRKRNIKELKIETQNNNGKRIKTNDSVN